MFDPLSKESIYQIIDLELEGLYKRVGDLGYEVTLTEPPRSLSPARGTTFSLVLAR